MSTGKNCVILASGNGSNALNLIDKFYHGKKGDIRINIAAVVSNIDDAPVVITVKEKAPGIPGFVSPFAASHERGGCRSEMEQISAREGKGRISLDGVL